MSNKLRILALASALTIGSNLLTQAESPPPGDGQPAVAPASQPEGAGPMLRLIQPDLPVLGPVAEPATQPATQPGISPLTFRRGPGGPPLPTSRADTTANLPMPDRAFLRLKLGWNELAEKDLTELLQADQTKLAAAVGLSELYRRTGRYEQSAKVLDEVADAGRKSAQWRCEKAELLATLGKYEEALKLAEAVLAEQETNLHARWLAGQQLETLGRIPQAIAAYKVADDLFNRTPPKDAADRTWAGLILVRYSHLIAKPVAYGTHIMQDFYQEAYEVIDRQYWPARIASADLAALASKPAMARGDYAAAIKINPNTTEGYVGAGHTLLDEFQFDQVEQLINQAKKINPKDPAVLELEAGLHLAERNYPAAAKSAQAGLEVNPRHLGLLGLLAAANLRQGQQDKVDELTRAARAINPKPAQFFAILGDWQAAARQFDSAEQFYKQAIDLAPWDASPMTSLGMMYMQTGQEDLANQMLEKAFAVDGFNYRSKNTLDLLDKLIAFDTVTSEHFIIHYNRAADGLIGPYFRDYLEGIYAELTRDYDAKLDRKVVVEVFPTHQDFSMRTAARPWIPTVGASTGWVIALYSPHDLVNKKTPQTGEPLGFNWARVLRHEFTHVVTLAATGNRIPHWFTEALAVHQEQTPPQWKWIVMLSAAVRQGTLFPVDQLDWKFIRPKAMAEREQAYAQSEWMAQFIIDRYGYPKINLLLKAFRDYQTQAQAFRDVLGLTEAEFDQAFAQWARQQVQKEWRMPVDKILAVAEAEKIAQTQPEDAKAQADLATAYLHAPNLKPAEKASQAEKAARAALALDPKQTAALEILGQVLEKTNWAQAKEFLTQLADLDSTVATAPRLLAQHAAKEQQWQDAIFWFTRLKLANQYDPTSYDGLAAIYLMLGSDDQAATELAELARREQSNPVYALQLARISSNQGKHEQAVYWLNEALHFNPFDPATHEKLAKSYLELHQPEKAEAELQTAIDLKPTEESYWARLAFVYDSQGKTALARKAAETAVQLRPDSPARDLLGRAAGSRSPTSQPQAQPAGNRPTPMAPPTTSPQEEPNTFFD